MPEANAAPRQWKNVKPNARIVLVVIALVVAAVAASSVYQVNADQRGVVTRFGRYHATVEEGLRGKLPLGIDRVIKVPQVVLSKQFGFRTVQAGVTTTYDQRDYSSESEMLTGDLNIVDVAWIINYRITDPRAWLFNVDDRRIAGSRSEDNRDKTLRDITQSVVNSLVGDRAILDVLSSEKNSIEFLSKEKIQEKLDFYDLGVSITEVKLQQVEPPVGEVQDAFEDVNKATQDRERLINEGERAYYTEIPRIEGEAKQLLAEAEGYRQARINRAQAEVALFRAIYQEYRSSPAVTRERLYYETLTEVFADGENTDLIDRGLENFLPLKNLGALGGQ